MGDKLIPALALGDCSEAICVRASRFWDFYDPHNETVLLHSDLVLIDEEGNSIHAQIYPPDDQQFKPLIKEGNVYNLSYFRVRKSGKYKPVDNDHMINFTRWTAVEEVVEIPHAFPMYTYSLIPMDQLPPRVDERKCFTDVIGVVNMVSKVSSIRRRARQGELLKRTITICDASGASLDITLWGERATTFPAEQVYKDGQTTPQIVIFVGTLVKSFADKVALTGGSSCKWYINLEVPEAKALTASVISMYCPVKWDQHMTSSEPQAFTAPEHKKISDIKWLHPFKNKKREWVVTVTVMKIDKSWWYNACKKCLRTAKPHGDQFKCTEPRCGTVGVPVPRYKLCIAAGDDTGETEFVIFGQIAQRLTRKPVDTLIADNPSGFIPDEITRLLEKVFVWNVSFTENTTSSGKVSFQVNTVVAKIDDGDALPVTPGGSQSSSLMVSRDAGSSMQQTPQKSISSALPLPPSTSEASYASSAMPNKAPLLIPATPATPESIKKPAKNETIVGSSINVADPESIKNPTENEPVVDSSIVADPDDTTTKSHRSSTRKRTRASPTKKTVKKLFTDEDTTDEYAGTATAAEPSEVKDN